MLLKARWVLPIRGPVIEDGAVRISGDRIVSVGPAAELTALESDEAVRDLGTAAILPGLVNAHSHLELTVMRGLLEDADFRTWITRLTTMKLERLTRDDLLDSARIGALEAVRAGVTCLADTCDSGVSARAMLEAGLAGVMYQEVFGPDAAQVDGSISGLVEKLESLEASRPAGSRVRIGVSPHAPFTVSADLFRRVTDLSRDRGIPMAIHAAESRAESDFLLDGTGPFGERFRTRGISWAPPGVSTVAWLDSLGVLEVKPLLIHAVQTTPADHQRIESSGASVVHCPKSNAKLGHGIAPLRAMRARGIRVGLGTDSVASNNLGDVLDEARSAVLLARAIERDATALDARQALELATIGGAEALGLDLEIGTLDPGKRADLCAISLDGFRAKPVHDVEAAIVWSCTADDVILTIAGGKPVFDRYGDEQSGMDERRLMARLLEIERALSGPSLG